MIEIDEIEEEEGRTFVSFSVGEEEFRTKFKHRGSSWEDSEWNESREYNIDGEYVQMRRWEYALNHEGRR